MGWGLRLSELNFKQQLDDSTWFVSRFGLAVRRYAGKREGLGSIRLQLSFFFKKVVVCGLCPVTLSVTSY